MFKHMIYFLTGTTLALSIWCIYMLLTHFHTLAQILKLGVVCTSVCILLYFLGYMICNFFKLLDSDEQDCFKGSMECEGLPNISGTLYKNYGRKMK